MSTDLHEISNTRWLQHARFVKTISGSPKSKSKMVSAAILNFFKKHYKSAIIYRSPWNLQHTFSATSPIGRNRKSSLKPRWRRSPFWIYKNTTTQPSIDQSSWNLKRAWYAYIVWWSSNDKHAIFFLITLGYGITYRSKKPNINRKNGKAI